MPYQCNITLKYSQAGHICLLNHVFSRYFLAFCVVEEVCILLNGNEPILRLIANCVINMLLVCY